MKIPGISKSERQQVANVAQRIVMEMEPHEWEAEMNEDYIFLNTLAAARKIEVVFGAADWWK